jgi:hypothetical protein
MTTMIMAGPAGTVKVVRADAMALRPAPPELEPWPLVGHHRALAMMRPLAILARAWAFPATLIGLAAVALAAATGGSVRRRGGVIEAHGGLVARFLARGIPVVRGAAAMTLGHVVIAQDEECLEWSRRHERVHVRQYERWGPFFIPAYVLACFVAAARGGHYYRDNVFELAAFREAPVTRPLSIAGERNISS